MAIREEVENLKDVSKKESSKANGWSYACAFLTGVYAGAVANACVKHDKKWIAAAFVALVADCISVDRTMKHAYQSGRCAGAADVAKTAADVLEPDDAVTIDI